MTYAYPGTAIELLYERYASFDLLVDSRRLADPEKTLFFALGGARTNGHKYIVGLYKRGVRHFVIRKKGGEGFAKDALAALREVLRSTAVSVVVADDPLAFLQGLAAHHRRQFQIPVVAITGSNGKTIVKDWLAGLLSRRFRVCASPRSFNSQIGVPLSVWQLRATHEIAVFEAGVSKVGEMERLADIIQPTCGAFTMLGSAHAEGFHSPEQKHREKMRLFTGADWVVVPADDNASIGLLRSMNVEVVAQLGFGHHLVEVEEVPLHLQFPALNAIYLENAFTAVAVAFTLGMSQTEIASGVADFQPLSNRLEQREGLHGGPVINDSYSNDISALTAALNFAMAQNPHEKLTLILGTLQPGTIDSGLKHILEDLVSRIITVGRRNHPVRGHLHYPDTAALLSDLSNITFSKETILIKGASYEGFDRIADTLSRKQHRTVLRIDLAALRHNFLLYRKQVDARMIVMVKASAYGGGALPVARTLVDAGADALAVAYPDEGKALREGGVELPIMVLNAAPHTFNRMREDALDPVVHSTEGLRQAAAAGLRVHLEIDSGMGRLGFADRALDDLILTLTTGRYERSVISVFTHLAASESPDHDEFTRQQLRVFDAAYERIKAVLSVAPLRHVLNTNGISRFPEAAFDFVRLGIGLYGVGDAQQTGLRPVLELTTRITAVYDRAAGTTIGYGRRGKLSRDSRIAVLAIGYADGLPRAVGEGRFSVMINGMLAPIIGAVCMDMTMVDVSGIAGVTAGGTAIVFGPDHPLESLAEAAQTIPYEILTGIGERVHRVYSQE